MTDKIKKFNEDNPEFIEKLKEFNKRVKKFNQEREKEIRGFYI